MSRRPVIEYRRAYEFASTPQQLWDAIEEVDQFEARWSWLEEFRLEGATLKAGSVLHGVVAPPVPYRMRVWIELTSCEPPNQIEAIIHGDLKGSARIEIRSNGAGTTAQVAWTVEMMQQPMRTACRFGRPLLQWGHDRVVEITVEGFRRRLESAD
jgi:carbon monoxide dehydrogenase subunit G